MSSVAVVGGGISGLTAAWTVAQRLPSAQVVVLEAASGIGGKLRLGEVAGIPVDVGAEAILTARPEGVQLLAELGLAGDRIGPVTTAASVFAGGFRHPLPARTLLGIPGSIEAARVSGLLTASGLAAIEAELLSPPLPPLTGDVSVGGLVRARLGDEIADRLVEPLLGGVYAGRADALSLAATVPALAAALRAGGGSLVQAVAGIAERGTRDPSAGPVFTSLVGGVGRLPAALAASGRFAVWTGTTAQAIRRVPGGFTVVLSRSSQSADTDFGRLGASAAVFPAGLGDPAAITVDAVIVATPPAKAARLLRDLAPVAAAELAAVESASVALVTLAFDGIDLPSGSGLLVAAGERSATKAITLTSQKWPVATGGLAVLRASVGRAGEDRALQRSDDDLIGLVRRELRPLLGVDAAPVDALVTRWGGGLPQYAVGHVERMARVRSAAAKVPGLAVCGAVYDGVGIPACIAAARTAADRVVAALDGNQVGNPVGSEVPAQ